MRTSDFRTCVWNKTAPPAPDMPALSGQHSADVVVIGGGFTGLSTALHLAEAGARAVVLEAQAPGFGASGRNNGQVIPAYSSHNPDDVVRLFGAEAGERLNAWVAGSADFVFELIARHQIACDAEQRGWVQPAHLAGRMAAVNVKHRQWAARGAPVRLLDAPQTNELLGTEGYHGAWMHDRGGHVQPLSFARGLAVAARRAGASLHGNSPATELRRQGKRWQVTVPGGAVDAEQVVIATNAYTDALWPRLRQCIVPLRSYHAATYPLDAKHRATVLPGGHGMSDTRRVLWAFRLDREHRLITTAQPLFTIGARASVRRMLRARFAQVFPQLAGVELESVWEGLIAMTPDRLPRYHELAAGVHAGLGYSGRGIALATAMGKMLAERVLGGSAEELPLPPTGLRPLPLHGMVVPLSRAMIVPYGIADRRP